MIQTRSNVAKKEFSKSKNSNAVLKMVLVIFTLCLIMALSVTNNYLFFKELLISSGIILFVTIIKFFEIKRV